MQGATLATGAVLCLALGLLVAAALHDLAWRLIPNRLPAGLLACGAALRLLQGELLAGFLACLAVLALAALAWRMAWLGGGDAKLLAATAAVVAPGQVPGLLLGTALAGGVLAVLVLLLRPLLPPPAARRPDSLLRRLWRTEAWRIRRGGPLPYAVAIAAGAAATLLGG